jgi:squalene-associated FAD-dependent desaturase
LTQQAADIVIVGAGFAGLSAGVRLSRAGMRVLVLEARSRLGGRATAFPDRETGERVDNGQHVILGCYKETLAFLSEIGALGNLRLQPQLSVAMIDGAGRRTRLTCPPLPAPLHLVAGVLDWDALAWRDRLSVLRMSAPLRLARRQLQPNTRTIAASPGETVEAWLVRNGQTARLRELLWDPLALAALNQPSKKAAAPLFARVLAEMFGSDSSAAAIGLPLKPLDEMYAEPARRYIETRGGTVRTGARASIVIERDAVGSVTVDPERWIVSRAIAAVPWHQLSTTLVGDTTTLDGLLDRARRTDPSPIVSVNLWLDRRVIDDPFVGLPGRTLQWVFDKREVFGNSAAHLSFVSSGAQHLLAWKNTDLIEHAHRELIEAVPQAREARLLQATVVREPAATFSLAPGQPARPSTETPIRGLYLAGDWIDTGLPATIESAVRSGHRAAEFVMADVARLKPRATE